MSGYAAQEPAEDSIASLWAQHDLNRLTWAFRAYAHFVESLSPEIRERLAHKDHKAEAYVVVFGKTQVGKTTLLMDLMGVLPSQMARVARVLRGGRPIGKSATATTMEYRRSADQRWGLRINEAAPRWFHDDEAMTLALGQLRTAMELRQLVVLAPCVVYVPLDFFDPHAIQPTVRMLDLPGDKPANPTEQDHVHAMARKYVPLADLILLVGRGDDLSFLQSGGLTLPGIEDWQSAPRRFRIVTTYSFTPQSVRERLRQHDGPADVQQFRQRLIEQIEKSIPLSADARHHRHFFPLEFGQSWLDAQKAQQLLYERVAPMVDALKRQLLEDIHASTTPLARLSAAVDAHVVIARVKEKRLTVMQDLTLALQTQLRKAQDEQAEAKNTTEQARKMCQHLHERLETLTTARLHNDLRSYFQLSGKIAQGDPRESVIGFKILVQQVKSSLIQCVAYSRPDNAGLADTAWFWRGVNACPDTNRVNTILEHAFSSLIATLDEYWVDSYWSTGNGSDYQRDIKSLANCIQDARSSLTVMASQMWLSAAQTKLLEHKQVLRAEQLKQQSWQQLVDDNIQPIYVLEKKLAVQARERQVFEQRMEADLAESRGFMDLLDKKYLEELQQRQRIIQTDDQPVSAFLGLLAVVQLEQVRQQVLLHTESADV